MTGEVSVGMRLDVLGPLVLRRGDEELTPSSAIARRLLCLLACRAPAAVSVDELVEVAWPRGDLPKEPAQNLHTHVARIRRLCGAGPGEVGIVETDHGGYRLAPGVVVLDLEVLASLTAPGIDADGDNATLQRLTRALQLWRGPSLIDLADTDAGRGDAVRLDELRSSLAEARFECLLAAGAVAEVAHEVEPFTVQHPYRERPYAVLMRALAQMGRQADALAAFQRLRLRLGEDLGLEPSRQLRELEADVLADRLPRGEDPTHAVRAVPDPGPPARLGPVVGREVELEAAESALRRSRLVTVIGAGGVGKTRLALELAHRHGEDRQVSSVRWYDLSSAERDDDVVDVLARAVLARRAPEEHLRGAVVRTIAEADHLVFLDNCEQVVDAAAELVADVLARSETVRVLVTSRTPLDIAGEVVVRLDPLRYDAQEAPGDPPGAGSPAVELFLERCDSAGLDVRASDPDRVLATRICRAVDGLPLGIELAAAQLRNLTLAQLADLLDRDLGPLEVGRRRGRAWHRSIGAAIEWSYRLLTSEDQELLATISVFAGSFDATAVVALLDEGEPEHIRDRLTTLCDLSLLTVEPGGTEPRFRLLGTTRRFGRKVLAAGGRDVALSARHSEWVRTLLAASDVALRGAGEPLAARAIDDCTDDVRAVLGRASVVDDVDTALTVCASLSEYAFERLRDDIFEWTDRALAMEGAHQHPCAARAMAGLGRGLTNRGELSRAAEMAHDAQRIAGQDAAAVVMAQHALALVALYSGRPDDVVAIGSTMVAAAEPAGDPSAAQVACALSGLARLYGGDEVSALEWIERSLRHSELSGQPSAQAWGQYGLGEVFARSDPDRASECLERAIRLGESVGNVFVVDVVEVARASMAASHEDPHTALRAFGRLVRRWDARNDWTHQLTTLQHIAPLLARVGVPVDAAILAGAVTAATERPLFGEAEVGIAALEQQLIDELGEDRFTELRDRGATMSRREVISLALRSAGR